MIGNESRKTSEPGIECRKDYRAGRETKMNLGSE
jgi:hypothetical protein